METFDEAELRRRVEGVVYASASTVDAQARPRVRILHPVWDWETRTVWIGTNPQGAMAAELASHPHLALCYLRSSLEPFATEQVYVDGPVTWIDPHEGWDKIRSAPPPVGYDPLVSWPSADDPKFGVLELRPSRIELAALSAAAGWSQSVWRA